MIAMDELELESAIMDDLVKLASGAKPKSKCLEVAEQLDKLAERYDGIAKSYQKKADCYLRLKEMVQSGANANREIAKRLSEK